MNKVLLALSMLPALSAPALASYSKAQDETSTRHSASRSYYQHVGFMPRLRANAGQYSDPYWAPCDYTTYADPNGCE
jgi:hypothetical protein